MNHSEVRVLLGDYLEGDLELAERTRLDEHLPHCPRCAQELAELRATIGLLRALPDPEPPPGLAGAVMQRVDAGEATAPILLRAVRRLAEPRLAAPLAAGLAGLAVFAGLQAISPQRGIPSVGPLPTLAIQPPVHTSAVLPPGSAAFTSDRASDELQRFLQNPNALLDRFASLAEGRRERAIRDFANRVSPRDAERVKLRLEASGHRIAPLVMVYLTPARPQDPAPALSVMMTSAESPAR